MEEIIKKISERVEEKIKKEFPEIEITETSMVKTNNKKISGISIRAIGETVSPVYWLTDIAKKINDGKICVEAAAEGIIENYKDVMKRPPRFPEMNRENAEKMLFACIVGTESNKEMLNGIPRMEIEDLSVIARFGVSGAYSILVTDDVCDLFEMSPDEALEVAIENTRNAGHRIMHITEVLMKMKKMDEIDDPLYRKYLDDIKDIKFFAVTNISMSQGAVVPFVSKEARSELREKIGGDYFILPSSIHECLAIGADGKSPDDLKELVVDVNENDVVKEEVLSGSVYFVGEDLNVVMR